jgi:hypothetical protein
MNRKDRRALTKQAPSEHREQLANQVALFDKLPESCTLCSETFDKKDREMLSSWKVVVIQEAVRLYCPHCIQKTEEEVDSERR